jgi:hypothetical protein
MIKPSNGIMRRATSDIASSNDGAAVRTVAVTTTSGSIGPRKDCSSVGVGGGGGGGDIIA